MSDVSTPQGISLAISVIGVLAGGGVGSRVTYVLMKDKLQDVFAAKNTEALAKNLEKRVDALELGKRYEDQRLEERVIQPLERLNTQMAQFLEAQTEVKALITALRALGVVKPGAE